MKDGSWEGKDLKIVKYGHHEEAISASKVPNISFLFKFNYPIFTEVSEYQPVAMEIGRLSR